MRPGLVWTCLVATLVGCGGGGSAPSAPSAAPAPHGGGGGSVPPAPGATQNEASAADAPRADGRIARSELEPILDAGLGRFLQGVKTQPYTRDGDFVGFRLKRLWPNDERFEQVELQPGDVIVRVNGQPIERPEQALRVWESMHVASHLVIEYLREGERRTLRYVIVDDSKGSP